MGADRYRGVGARGQAWQARRRQICQNEPALQPRRRRIREHHARIFPNNVRRAKRRLRRQEEAQMNGTELCVQPHGFNWHRPDRTLAIDGTRGETWDRGYVQSISNIFPAMGDRLYIYYTGFAGDKSKAKGRQPKGRRPTGLYANGVTGVALLRRDGFVSLNLESGGAGENSPARSSFPENISSPTPTRRTAAQRPNCATRRESPLKPQLLKTARAYRRTRPLRR